VDCSVGPARPTGPRTSLPPDQLTIGISNGTTLDVTLMVNGAPFKTYGPLGGEEIPASKLPPLPWDVEARSASGRLLLSMAVHAGDLWREPCGNNALAARKDLSCARLELWSVADALGPGPGPGTPGDCEP
jgi:hypothetical protein